MERIKSRPEVIKTSNFLSIKKAELISQNNLTLLVAPNRAGKNRLLMLTYCVFWSLWKSTIEGNTDKKIVDILKLKIKRNFC